MEGDFEDTGSERMGRQQSLDQADNRRDQGADGGGGQPQLMAHVHNNNNVSVYIFVLQFIITI